MSRNIHDIPGLTKRRQELRREATPAEVLLWKNLKHSKLEGRKFRRQHSIGKYVVDFFCPAENLIVELDGAYHFIESGPEYDRQRDDYLKGLSMKILRFENKMALENMSELLNKIRKEFR